MSLQKLFTASCCTMLLTASSFSYADESSHNTNNIITPSQIKWLKGPDSLPPGVKVAVLEGNPEQEGPFTIRLKTPANYKIPPHWHPNTEHITILSGGMNIGMGDKFDLKKSTHVPVGGYFYMEPKMHHFAYTKTPTIIQAHG